MEKMVLFKNEFTPVFTLFLQCVHFTVQCTAAAEQFTVFTTID